MSSFLFSKDPSAPIKSLKHLLSISLYNGMICAIILRGNVGIRTKCQYLQKVSIYEEYLPDSKERRRAAGPAECSHHKY